jgi:hypothetical protein
VCLWPFNIAFALEVEERCKKNNRREEDREKKATNVNEAIAVDFEKLRKFSHQTNLKYIKRLVI